MANVKATHRLLDSVWTAEYEVISESEKTIKLIKYSRNDPEGYNRERELPQCTDIEAEGRIITHLMVRDKYKPFDWVSEKDCDRIYKLINPDHVFSYGA